jgi:kynurenine formamidase
MIETTLGTLVDLTLPISEAHPSYWPMHVPFQQKTFNWYESRSDGIQTLTDDLGPYATKWLLIDEHTGTHMDAPTHFIPPAESGLPFANEWGSVSADQIPLSQLIGPAAVIDVPSYEAELGESPLITADDIRAWENQNGGLTSDEVVLFRSGWDSKYVPGVEGSGYAKDILVGKTRIGWPAPDEGAIDHLAERGIRCVGTDAPTMGPAQDGQGVHVHGLGGGMVFIECLAHLDQLPVRGATFMFLPLKTLHGTGAPGRAIALIAGSHS